MKRFSIKVYELDGSFKKTINDNIILNNITFSSQKNGGQGELDLLLNLDYNTTTILKSDFVKVYVYDDNFTNGKLIYTGIIEEIKRNYKATENTINLVCRGLGSLLTRVMYQFSGYTFTKTDTASNIIIDVINYFNSIYTGGWLNTTGIVATTGNISIDYDYTTCFDVIQSVVDVYGSFWLIKPDGTCVFNSSGTNVLLTGGKDVQNIDINEDSSEIINKVIVEYNGGRYTQSNSSSIASYGLFEKEYNNQDIGLSEATTFAANILAKYGDKTSVVIELNTKFAFENIVAGDTIKVRNLLYTINSPVEKIDYSPNLCKIYLDKYDSVGKVLIT